MTHAQMSRQNGAISAMFISRVIELCDVSKVVLHEAETLLWMKTFHFINSFNFINCCVCSEDGL